MTGVLGRSVALAALALLSAGAAASDPVVAQSGARSVPDTPIDFDIPALPMARALNAWAVQANAQLFVDPEPVAHLTAPAVKGRLGARQALRRLLARSNLEVVQGQDGVVVVRPRAVRAATRPPTAPVATPPAPPPADVLPAAQIAAPRRDIPWLLRIDLTTLDDTGAGRSGGSASFAVEYRWGDHISVGLSETLPRTHSFAVPGAASERASARLQTSVLGVQYYFTSQTALRPYLGTGIGLTVLSHAQGAPGLQRVTPGPVAQAGADWVLDSHWRLNADVSWVQVRPSEGTGDGPRARIDPVQIGFGVVYRF